jgi:signal transduction histidine kinase
LKLGIQIILLFALSASFTCCFAQNQSVVDSLQKKLSITTSDTAKILISAEIIYETYASKPDTAWAILTSTLALSRKINYQKGVALLLNHQAMLYYFKGENDRAMQSCFESLKISEEIKDNELIGRNLSRIGDIEREQKNYQSSYQNQSKAITYLSQTDNKEQLALALNRMGLLLDNQQKYKEALSYFEQSLVISKTIKNQRQIALAWYYMGEVYSNTNRYEKAISCFEQSFVLNKKVKSQILAGSILNHLARIYRLQKSHELSIIHSREALRIAKSINTKSEIKDSYENLYEVYLQTNQKDSALWYIQMWVSIKDSIFNDHKDKQIDQLKANYEIEKQRLALQKQNAELGQQRSWTYVFLTALIFVLVIAFILYRNNISKYKANYKLQVQRDEIWKQKLQIEEQSKMLLAINEEMSQQKEEIETLNNHLENRIEERTQELKVAMDDLEKQNQDLQQFSYIISHNLRAPVARIAGLINILDKKNIQDTYNQEIIGHISNATNSLDVIIKDLTEIIAIRSSIDKTKELISLSEIFNTTKLYFINEIEKIEAKITTDFSKQSTIFSVRSYLQSIVHNLVSNAIKYRCLKRTLELHIYTTVEDKYICLAIKDNGIGIDLKNIDPYKIFGLYQRVSTHIEGKGLGLYLVKTQVESLGGKIFVESQLDVGTTFFVYFPKQNA